MPTSWGRYPVIALAVLAAACAQPAAPPEPSPPTPSSSATPPPTPPAARRLPPISGVFDYQLGGSYELPGLAVVVRDASTAPSPKAYDVCYLNGFQTQPDARADWLENHGTALLRDANGSPTIDPDWPDEFVLDPSAPAQRKVILDVMGPLLTGCARAGFDAVEIDNFDTFTRFADRIDPAGALDLARSYVALAHEEGLAIGQKNAAESTETGRRDVGFDFAVAEECGAYDECAAYSTAYGPHVLQIEYSDNLPESFATVCDSPDRAPLTILRDRDLLPRGTDGYVYEQCR